MKPDAPVPEERIVRCPSCGGRSVYGPSNPFRPFCCATCKGIDLGAWASDQYRIAADKPEEADDPAAGNADAQDV